MTSPEAAKGGGPRKEVIMPGYDVIDALAGVRSAGCIQPHVRSFAEHLMVSGYALLSTREYMQTEPILVDGWTAVALHSRS
jgi:hypothetical protein